jgi:hypothetical protein
VERGFALEDADGTLTHLDEVWSDDSVRMNEGGCDPDGHFYSRDSVHRVVGFLHGGSEALEWGPELEGQPGTERYPGTGPYDTGAV